MAVLLLSSCSYKFPVSEEKNIPVNESLIGTWQSPSEKNKNPELSSPDENFQIIIKKSNACEYSIKQMMGIAAEDSVEYTGWEVKINNQSFLQLKYTDLSNSAPYLLIKYEIKDECLTFKYLNPQIIDIGFDPTKNPSINHDPNLDYLFKNSDNSNTQKIVEVKSIKNIDADNPEKSQEPLKNESQEMFLNQIIKNLNNPNLFESYKVFNFTFVKDKSNKSDFSFLS